MEKKVEVITQSGKTVRVMPHMLEDMALFGVTQVRKVVKETPKELIKVPVKPTEVLPQMVNTRVAPVIPELIPAKSTEVITPVKLVPRPVAKKKSKK